MNLHEFLKFAVPEDNTSPVWIVASYTDDNGRQWTERITVTAKGINTARAKPEHAAAYDTLLRGALRCPDDARISWRITTLPLLPTTAPEAALLDIVAQLTLDNAATPMQKLAAATALITELDRLRTRTIRQRYELLVEVIDGGESMTAVAEAISLSHERIRSLLSSARHYLAKRGAGDE